MSITQNENTDPSKKAILSKVNFGWVAEDSLFLKSGSIEHSIPLNTIRSISFQYRKDVIGMSVLALSAIIIVIHAFLKGNDLLVVEIITKIFFLILCVTGIALSWKGFHQINIESADGTSRKIKLKGAASTDVAALIETVKARI
jgi:hypothetical protein